MPIGITFNPLTFPPGVSIVEAVFAPGLFKMPTGTFWAGLTFDNADGTTTADETTLNLMGQGIFTPPNTGASSPAAFITDFPGSYFNVGHPSGHRFDFPDGPPANFGWEFYAISSTPTVSSTWGRIKNIYR
jgi:hypothetical protein